MEPITDLAWLCTQRDNWIARDVTEKDGGVSVKSVPQTGGRGNQEDRPTQ